MRGSRLVGHDLKIGVLALQGGFDLHLKKLLTLPCTPFPVRTQSELNHCDGLIMPGGESTAIAHIMEESGLTKSLRNFEKPLFGTCAGMILLAKWGKLSLAMQRNAYGRQSDSFSAQLTVSFPEGEKKCEAIFIRAPRVQAVLSNDVSVLATYHGEAVFVAQKHIFGATFHPELTQENHFHRFFLEVCDERKNNCAECR